MLTRDQVQSKSQARLSGLLPVVRLAAERLIDRCYARGVPIVITQGLRTIAEQDALYAQGRTKPGAKVTNARGGYSYHNFGAAIDFALLLPDGRNVSWDMTRDGNGNKLRDWMEVAEEGKKLGFAWGGDWKDFKDNPHFEMTFGLTTAQYRAGRRPTQAQIEAATRRILDGDAPEPKHPACRIVVNGVEVASGLLIDGRAYAALRAVGEAAGCVIGWDNVTKTATVNGKPVAGMLIDGVTYVALRAAGEAVGGVVAWDGQSKTASITV
ncbi:hypothetical protein PA598K_01322 [Paenibacillus sp. 598K]|uniref:M15 family metallopeptidase n=1 Tax=Paenibacillus sp. 598K TaxID=1117987 RepID=UPI000FFA101B|nr:M15 family metallopeptidase [Paenibacillus sp. 598K]GBF73037.1 hypothetical protein PA598K_01322 [Paenibacillus sp. 598K]